MLAFKSTNWKRPGYASVEPRGSYGELISHVHATQQGVAVHANCRLLGTALRLLFVLFRVLCGYGCFFEQGRAAAVRLAGSYLSQLWKRHALSIKEPGAQEFLLRTRTELAVLSTQKPSSPELSPSRLNNWRKCYCSRCEAVWNQVLASLLQIAQSS